MLDKYIEACARTNCSGDGNKLRSTSARHKSRRKGADDEPADETRDDEAADPEGVSQSLQLIQMQLQFEKQRRQVHAERNRRLLGKLRGTRALEESNSALNAQLRMLEKEIESLKEELNRGRKASLLAEERYAKDLHHWQSKCVEEEQEKRLLKERAEFLELELKNEQKKVAENERQTRSAEAALFDAAHQLKGALKAASHGEELKRVLETVQKKFLLLGEAQSRLQESISGPTSVVKEEAAQIQKAYSEELINLRRQLDSRSSLVEALRTRLVELESKEAGKEAQLLEQQRLLQEAKERHEAELRAVESKYDTQVKINLYLEARILELHCSREIASCGAGSSAMQLASSASPKERSPPLSASLASSSEGSLAFVHSGTGIIMNDCCDPAGEIPNLQAIVEPAPSQATTPTRSQARRVSTRD